MSTEFSQPFSTLKGKNGKEIPPFASISNLDEKSKLLLMIVIPVCVGVVLFLLIILVVIVVR